MKNTKLPCKNIVIDMTSNAPSDIQALPPELLIHYQQFESCNKLIHNQKISAIDYAPEKEHLHYHNTITITGARGVGKTTFLLSIKKYYEEVEAKDYAVIDIIDPSFIEKKQHPFINILALLHRYILDNIPKPQTYQVQFEYAQKCNKNYKEYYYKEWEKCYSDVLKALPYMDGIGKQSAYIDWDDSEYITEQGIRVVEHFNQLEHTFHLFVNYSLKLLDKKCFIIYFDDIDTNFNKGNEVLETIRKFLSTPQIIVLLTGDLELYRNLVRQAQWECFKDEYLKKEEIYSKRKKEEFSEMINHLENQYLLKLFKPEYRLTLDSLREKLERERNIVITVKYFDNESAQPIQSYYKKFIEKLGFNKQNSFVNSILIDRLLSFSIRTQIRILTYLKTETRDISYSAPYISNLFWNDLIQMGINCNILPNKNLDSTLPLLHFLQNNKLSNKNINFLSYLDNEINTKAVLGINFIFNYSLKDNPSLIFDYWIRISIIYFFLSQESDINQDKLLKESKIFSDDVDLCDMVTNLEIYLNKKYIYTSKSDNKNMDNNIPGCLTIDYNEELTIDSLNKLLFLLPIYSIDIKNHNRHTYYSLFKLFAIIGELLKIVYNSNQNEYLENEKKCINNISLFLRKHSSIQSYFLDIENNMIKEDIKDKKIIKQPSYRLDKKNLEQFSKDIYAWAKNFKKNNINIDLYCINTIFIKFASQLSSINEDKKSYSIGHYINRALLAFYNSCIVEECLNNDQYEVNINKSFYETEGDILANNYQVFKSTFSNIKSTFFQWIYNCPLLESFTSEMTRYIFILGGTDSSIYNKIWDKHRADFLKKQIENIQFELSYIEKELGSRSSFEIEARQADMLELKYQTNKRIFTELSRAKGNNSLLNNLDLLVGETIAEKMDILQKDINQLSERLINADNFLYQHDYGNYEERTEARKQLIRRRRFLIEQKKLIEDHYPTLLTDTEQLQQKAILGGSDSDNSLTLKLNQYFMYRDVSDFI